MYSCNKSRESYININKWDLDDNCRTENDPTKEEIKSDVGYTDVREDPYFVRKEIKHNRRSPVVFAVIVFSNSPPREIPCRLEIKAKGVCIVCGTYNWLLKLSMLALQTSNFHIVGYISSRNFVQWMFAHGVHNMISMFRC